MTVSEARKEPVNVAAPARPGRRTRRREATRRALLAAGLALVRDHGLFGTRVEDVTERCDVAKGAFYNYFESKDAFFAELLAHGVEILVKEYLVGGPSWEDPAARIRWAARAHGRFFDERSEYAILFHQGRGLLQLSDGAGSALQGIYRDYLGRLAEVAVPPGLPAARGLDLAALLAGAVAGHRSHRISAGLGGDARAVEDLLALGLPALAAGGRRRPR